MEDPADGELVGGHVIRVKFPLTPARMGRFHPIERSNHRREALPELALVQERNIDLDLRPLDFSARPRALHRRPQQGQLKKTCDA